MMCNSIKEATKILIQMEDEQLLKKRNALLNIMDQSLAKCECKEAQDVREMFDLIKVLSSVEK